MMATMVVNPKRFKMRLGAISLVLRKAELLPAAHWAAATVGQRGREAQPARGMARRAR